MGRRHGHNRVRRERKAQTVSFPPGVTPPIKGIIGETIVNGQKELEYEYYPTSISASAFHPSGNQAELEIAMAIAPNAPELFDDPDVIDFDTYVKEQLDVIAKEKEIVEALKAVPDPAGRDREGFAILFTWLKQIKARRNIPSKDWKPINGNYRLPQYAHLPEPQMPAEIE